MVWFRAYGEEGWTFRSPLDPCESNRKPSKQDLNFNTNLAKTAEAKAYGYALKS